MPVFRIGYGVYKHYGNRDGVEHACCNAHARRKFDEAKFTDKKRAEQVIALYGELYAVEKYAKENNLSFDERKTIRQAKSVLIFEEMAAYVKEQLTQVTTLRSRSARHLSIFLREKKNLACSCMMVCWKLTRILLKILYGQ